MGPWKMPTLADRPLSKTSPVVRLCSCWVGPRLSKASPQGALQSTKKGDKQNKNRVKNSK